MICRKRIRDANAPLVVAIETCDSNPNTANFIKSLELNDWDYEIIGSGHTWSGMYDKIILNHKYLQTADPEKLIVLSDARDVFCVRTPQYFKDVFDNFKKPLVASMEIFCQSHPYDVDLSESWQCVPLNKYWAYTGVNPTEIKRKYVCAGLLAGKAKHLLEFFEWVIKSKWKDDQAALGEYANTFPERIAVDVDARLLHNSEYGVNIGLQTHKQWSDSPSIAELTGRLNYFLHIPGIEKSIGQRKIYDLVKTLIINMNISSKWIHEGYAYPPPLWNKGCDEEPRFHIKPK